jgi:DNA-binding protein HU-beta
MSIDKQELVRRVSQRVDGRRPAFSSLRDAPRTRRSALAEPALCAYGNRETDIVEAVIDATLEEIYESLQQGDSVSLRNFGTFYVRVEPKSWVFKFNPSQRLRKLFGWASTAKT